MSLAATVLVPTHTHGPTLLCSVTSALEQTVTDLEVFIVGDGVPDEARPAIATLLARDARVRFFDNPKGPRHGEEHRHVALDQARGEVILYLSDDDLWLPDHVATMRDLLAGADFAHPLPLRVDPGGGVATWAVDLALPFYRELLCAGENRIPLSCGGHTQAVYRALPYGWRTAPPEIPTDLYMWQQLLSMRRGCRCAGGTRPTVLNFPSPQRREWSLSERVEELERWLARVRDPEWRRSFAERVHDVVVRERAGVGAELEADRRYLLGQRALLAREVDEQRTRLDTMAGELGSAQRAQAAEHQRADEARRRIDDARQQLEEAREQLDEARQRLEEAQQKLAAAERRSLEREQQVAERDRQAAERDRQATEREQQAAVRDRQATGREQRAAEERDRMVRERAAADATGAALRADLGTLTRERDESRREAVEVRGRLDEIVATATWRLHDRLAAGPLRGALRMLARTLAGRRGR